MLDFRRHTRSPNYLAGRQQYKLLALMTSAGLVLVLVSLAAEPDRWDWMFSSAHRGHHATDATVPFAPDTRLIASSDKTDAPGTFVAPLDGLPTDVVAKHDLFFPGVRTDYLQTVRDDTVFRNAESDAWFHLFDLLAVTDDQTLAKASTGKITFRQLYQQPRAYRGRVVTLSGTVRGAREIEAPRNAYGIKKYWQLSIEPTGEPGQLVVAYSLTLPGKFPIGDRINERVTLQGFFFKRWAYPAADAVRTAPLMLTRTVEWKPVPPASVQSDISPRIAVLAAFGLFLMVAVGYAILRARRIPVPANKLATVQFPPDVVAVLAQADADNSRPHHQPLADSS